MEIRDEPQTAFDEAVLEPEQALALIQALDEREDSKGAFGRADDYAKFMAQHLPEGTHRIGKYRIVVESKTVVRISVPKRG